MTWIARACALALPMCVACSGVRDALSGATGPWSVAETEDKLTNEKIITASMESASEDKSLVGKMALECRMPSKQLQLTISSFGQDGEGLAFEDTVAVRTRSAVPANLAELFSGAENSGVAKGMMFGVAMVAAGSKGGSDGLPPVAAAPLSMPAGNVVRISIDALLTNLTARAELLRQIAAEPGRLQTVSAARIDSLRAFRASLGDADTTWGHLYELANGDYRRLTVDKLFDQLGAKPEEFRLARDSVDRIIQAAKDELAAERAPMQTASESAQVAAQGTQFAAFASEHFGDLASYKSAADLLRGMGPELAFQYYNKGRSNTLLLKVADVSSMLERCK